jgi:hypothetical protein
MPNEFIIKNGLISQGNITVTGSVTATSITISGSSAATLGSNTFIGTEIISGSLSISGSGTPFTLNTDVLEITGSLIVTGSSVVTGSLTVITGSLIEFQVTNTGVKVGNNITDTHTVTGSLSVSGSQTFIGTKTITGSVFITGSKTLIGTNTITGSMLISGSLTTTGTITATTLVVQTITSSISSITGSTNFGSLAANTHTFTGSILTSGSMGIGISTLAAAHMLQINNPTQNYVRMNMTNTSTGTSNTDGLIFQQEVGNSIIKNQENGYLAFGVNGAETNLVIAQGGNVGVGTATPSAPLEISYNNTSFTTTPILSLNNTNVNGQTHINFLITGSLFGKIRSDYEGGMIYATNNRGADRSHNFLVNGDVGTGSVVMNIKANGKVGIGTTNPSSTLGIASTGADGLVMEPDLGSTNNSSRLFFTGSVQSFGLFNNAGDLRLTYAAQAGNTSGTSFVRFTNTGKYFRMEGSTGGIQFGGDTAAANALNDYEEGTWTPTLTGASGSPTYLSGYRNGWYTKVGRVVNIAWFISFSKNTLSGTLGLTGLPFALLNGPGVYYPQGTVLLDSLGTATNNITLQGANNTSLADFIGGNGSTATHTGLPISVLGAGSMECRGTLTYFTA